MTTRLPFLMFRRVPLTLKTFLPLLWTLLWTLFPCFLRLIYYSGPRFNGRSAETWWQRGDLFRGVSSSPQGVPAHREPNPANPISSHICTHTKICLGARTYVLYTRLLTPRISTRSVVMFLLSKIYTCFFCYISVISSVGAFFSFLFFSASVRCCSRRVWETCLCVGGWV